MSVAYEDYYSALGVERTASQDEIQKAFRKLARKCHPDVSKEKDAEEKFKKLNEAYEVLKDPEKRKLYDSLGSNWKAGQNFQPPPGFEEFFRQPGMGQGGRRARSGPQGATFSFGGGGAGGFSDFFESIFGAGMGREFGGFDEASSPFQSQAPSSYESQLKISLEDAYRGGKRNLSIGLPDGSTKTLAVNIPAGIADGTVMRLGKAAGLPGEVRIKIRVTPHPRFRLSGRDLEAVVPLSPWEAALGSKIPLETLGGQVTLSVPPGSQSGQKLRLKGRGMPQKSGASGDLIVQLSIVVPRSLSAPEKELFKKLSETSTFNPRGQ